MSKSDIKNLINQNITDNNSQDITAAKVRTVLDGMVDGLASEESVAFEPGTGTNSVQQKGTGAVASGTSSVAEGHETEASGNYSHAEGYRSAALGIGSHAEGVSTTASSNYSHAEGTRCVVSANAAHAEGSDNTVNDDAISSHVGGNQSSTKAKFSFAHGNYATTGPGADSSFALGAGVKTSNAAEFSIGRYNKSNTNTRFSVGIGTAGSDLGRKNAFEIMQNGDAYLYGVGNYVGTNPVSGTNDLVTIVNRASRGIELENIPENTQIGDDLNVYFGYHTDIILQTGHAYCYDSEEDINIYYTVKGLFNIGDETGYDYIYFDNGKTTTKIKVYRNYIDDYLKYEVVGIDVYNNDTSVSTLNIIPVVEIEEGVKMVTGLNFNLVPNKILKIGDFVYVHVDDSGITNVDGFAMDDSINFNGQNPLDDNGDYVYWDKETAALGDAICTVLPATASDATNRCDGNFLHVIANNGRNSGDYGPSLYGAYNPDNSFEFISQHSDGTWHSDQN